MMAPTRAAVTGGGIELEDTRDARASAPSPISKIGSSINSQRFTCGEATLWPSSRFFGLPGKFI